MDNKRNSITFDSNGTIWLRCSRLIEKDTEKQRALLEQYTPPQSDADVNEQHRVTSSNKVRGRKKVKRNRG